MPIDRIVDLEAAQSDEQIADDNLLLILLSGNDYEVLTVRSIESPSGGIDINDTLYAKAFKAGMLPSNALIANYTEAPPEPPSPPE